MSARESLKDSSSDTRLRFRYLQRKPVNQMSRLAAVSSLGAEFNQFLYAPIGAERNGNRLSVLSALGRCDVDPWEMAAALACMPRDAAIGKLVALLSTHSDPWAHERNLEATATSLIALLPTSRNASVAKVSGSSRGPVAAHVYFSLAYVTTCLIFIALLQFAQSFHATITPTKDDRQTVSGGASSTTTKPASSDQSGPGNR